MIHPALPFDARRPPARPCATRGGVAVRLPVGRPMAVQLMIVVVAVLTVGLLLGPALFGASDAITPFAAYAAFGVVALMALVTVGCTLRAMRLAALIDRHEQEAGLPPS